MNAGQSVATESPLHMWIISFLTNNGLGNVGLFLNCHRSNVGFM